MRGAALPAPALSLTLLLGFGWVGCGGEGSNAPAISAGGTGGARDGGAGSGGGDASAGDAAVPDADGDLSFDELHVPEPADAGTDASTPARPEDFACGEERWGDGAHCDCGCLVADPDCAGRAGCTEPGCEAPGCDVRHDASGAAIRPTAYTCAPSTFDALDGCDCGCGAIDPDCIGNGCTEPGCKEEACQRCRDDAGEPLSCSFACDEALLGDGTCDCGCGAADPDCGDLGCPEPGCFKDMCERCYGAAGEIACARGACPAGFKGDGACDCGCRERDPDCIFGEAYCLEPSCSAPGCARCFDDEGAEAVCEDWLCELYQPGAGDGCNCGCGAADADCAPGEGCVTPGCLAEGCTSCRTEDGAPMSCMP